MHYFKDAIFDEEFDVLLKDFVAEAPGIRKEQLRKKVINRAMPYVERIARGLARRSSDPVDDLIQVGCLGLMKALNKFNPLAGSRFKTYATYLITGEIRHYLRDKTAVIKAPRQMYELYYRMNQIVQRLSDHLGRTPTDEEIAEELQCPLATVQDVTDAERRRSMVSLDQFVGSLDGSQGESQVVERLVDDKYLAFLQTQEDRMFLERALKILKPDLKSVVVMTYYEDMSQAEIAKVLGISQMQVSRRLRKALDILYRTLNPDVACRA